jgi:hypothetical protein
MPKHVSWRGFVVAAGFLTILGSTACGASSDGGACRGTSRGCVDLLNFYSTPVTLALTGDGSAALPAATAGNGVLSPGTSTIIVTSTLGSASVFTATVASIPRTVTCTVTSQAWQDVAPSVVVQPSGDLSCTLW